MRLPQIARRPVGVTVLAATLLSGWGCHRGGAAPPRPAKAEATQPPDDAGAWYRGLVQIHGDRLVIGTAPAGSDHGYWISSKSESEPTAEEYQRFYDGLSTRLRALAELRLPGVDSLKVAYLGGISTELEPRSSSSIPRSTSPTSTSSSRSSTWSSRTCRRPSTVSTVWATSRRLPRS